MTNRTYVCSFKGMASSRMFTEGKHYSSTPGPGQLDTIIDDLGHKRCLSRWDLRFSTGTVERYSPAVFAHFQILGEEINMAANQKRWDEGTVSIEACRRKGAEHAAYGWARNGLGFPGSQEQINAYHQGYDEENTRMTSAGSRS